MRLSSRFMAPIAQQHSRPSRIRRSGLTYFGAAGWEIQDGNVTVLVDPYISRLKYVGGGHPDDDRPAFARSDLAWSDTTLIDGIITGADYILIHHSHFDHLGDVPYIAKKTGAKVIGTETTIAILRAYDVPGEQLYAVRGARIISSTGFRYEWCRRCTPRSARSTTTIHDAGMTKAALKPLCGSTNSSRAGP